MASPSQPTRRPAIIMAVSARRAASRLETKEPTTKPALVEPSSTPVPAGERPNTRPATSGTPATKT